MPYLAAIALVCICFFSAGISSGQGNFPNLRKEDVANSEKVKAFIEWFMKHDVYVNVGRSRSLLNSA